MSVMDKVRDFIVGSGSPTRQAWVFTGTEVKETIVRQAFHEGKPIEFWDTGINSYRSHRYKTEELFDTEEEAIRHGIKMMNEGIDHLNYIKEKLEDRSLELVCQTVQ